MTNGETHELQISPKYDSEEIP